MNGNLIKKFGSQGQQKSFLIALKLAQIKELKKLPTKIRFCFWMIFLIN
jgi:DNA replication and repair protein RecF